MNRLARFAGRWGIQPVERPPVAEVDPEAYSAIYAEGHEDAIAQGLVYPPSAKAWLDGRLTRERVTTLRTAAEEARNRDDPAAGWLDALADREAEEPSDTDITIGEPVDLSPFQAVLDEIETRKRAFGGGTQDAYHNASEMLRSAFSQYRQVE